MNKDIRLFVELNDRTIYEVSNVLVGEDAGDKDITVMVKGKPYPLNRTDIKRFFTKLIDRNKISRCINSPSAN